MSTSINDASAYIIWYTDTPVFTEMSQELFY